MKPFFIPIFLSFIFSPLITLSADPSPAAPLDLATWNLETLKGATATLSNTTDAPKGAPSLVIKAQTGGSGELWAVQLDYPISVLKGKTYHLKFIIKCAPDHYVFLGVTQLHDPYASLADGRSLELSADWQEVSYDFTPSADEPEARILLTNLNAPGAQFSIANFTLASE